MDKLDNYYGINAYHSNCIPVMPAQTKTYRYLGYSRLPWGNTLNRIPTYMGSSSVLLMKSETDRLAPYGKEIPREQ